MNIEPLFKLLLQNEFFKNIIFRLHSLELTDDNKTMVTTLAAWHGEYDRDATMTEFTEFFWGSNPALTDAQQHKYKGVLATYDAAEQIQEDLAEGLIIKAFKEHRCKQIAEIAAGGMNGDDDALAAVRCLIESYDEVSDDDPFMNITPVETDIDAIIEAVAITAKWQFNLPALSNHIAGIGPGTFMYMFARPEVGKTAKWVSMVAAPGGFLDQGANVAAFINEEPGVRTMSRCITAVSQIPFADIKNDPTVRAVAMEKFNAVKENLKIFDCVGLPVEALADYARRNNPDIIVVDQLDKLTVAGTYGRGDERLEALYIAIREIAKRYGCAIIGLTQASADAQDKSILDLSMSANSKTGKAAEADVVIGIGHDPNAGENIRTTNILKNKLPAEGAESHAAKTVKIIPLLSTYRV